MAEDARQHLQTLGLEPGATPADIKHAYRELAAMWHPDRYPNAPHLRDIAQSKMTAINAAYQYLKTHDISALDANASGPAPSYTRKPAAPETHPPTASRRSGASGSSSASGSRAPALQEVHALRVAFAPLAPVTSLALSPDGGLILAAVGAYAMWWDAPTGRQVQGIRMEKGTVHCVAVAPNGRYVALANNLTGWMGGLLSEVRVCDLLTGHERQRMRLSGHVTSLAFSHDGKQIAAGTSRGDVQFWEAENRREVQTFAATGEGAIRRIAYVDGSQAAKQVVTLKIGNVLSEITLWDVRRARRLKEYTRHIQECLTYGQIRDVCPAPDGRLLLVANNDAANRNYALRLWDIQTGEEHATPARFVGHTDALTCAAWSAQNNLALSGSEDKTVRAWDTQTGREAGRGVGHTRAVRAVAASPDGSLIVSGADDGTARVWKR